MRQWVEFVIVAIISFVSSVAWAGDVEEADVVGSWKGVYECGGDEVGLSLEVESSEGRLQAVASYYPIEQSPRKKSGKFRLTGGVTGTGQVEFGPDEWIEQPPDHVMIGFEGRLSEGGDKLSGDVTDAYSCEEFTVYREGSDAASAAPERLSDEATEGDAPDGLACDDGYYQKSDPDDQFRLLYCDFSTPVQENEGGYVESDAVYAARAHVRRYLKHHGPDAKERWRAAYVHLCGTVLDDDENPYPMTALTCKWHADRMSLDALFEQESWMPDAWRGEMRNTLEADVETIASVVESSFAREDNQREWEVYYDRVDEVWEQYVADRENYAKYYEAVETFQAGIAEGDVDGCAGPLREKLTEYVNAGDVRDRESILDRMADPVGYAITEALARCHWYNDRKLLTGAYVKLLKEKPRRVTFGERLYYAQLAELQKDARKAEKMPHLKGKKLLEREPEDLRAPRVLATNEARQRWYDEGWDLYRDVATKDDSAGRVEQTDDGVVIHFPEREVEHAVEECEKTDRIDRVTITGEVLYEHECEKVGTKTTTLQLPSVEIDEASGIESGDWVQLAHDPSSDEHTLYIAAESDKPSAQALRVLEIDVE